MRLRLMYTGTDNFDTFMSELASALDAQWDSTEYILYRGESTMGFECRNDNGLYIRIKNTDEMGLPVYEGDTIIIEKNGACAIFGIIGGSNNTSSDTNGLRCAIVPYSNSEGGGYMYILSMASTTQSNDTYKYCFGFSDGSTANDEEAGSMGSVPRVRAAIPTIDVVSLAPLAIADKYTFNAFVAYAAPGGTLGSTPFTVNGSKYIPLSGNIAIAMS